MRYSDGYDPEAPASSPPGCQAAVVSRAEAEGGATVPTPEKIAEQYQQGDRARMDYFISLMQAITEDNAVEFAAFTPPDLLEEVRKYVAGCPHNEEGWAQLRWYAVRTW